MKKVLSLLLLSAVLGPSTASAEIVQRSFAGRTLNLEEVFFDGFDKDLSNWRVEGDAGVGVREGFLEVDATAGSISAATIWCAREFSGPQVVEYDVRLMPGSLQSNINMFLMAAVPDEPGSIGTGRYSEYHLFPNYLVTILNATSPDKKQMLRLRMRLNPGFELVSEGWFEPLEFGHVYHIAYVIRPPELSVYIGDRLAGQCRYQADLNKGLHALRIWHTHSLYDNFRVSRIVE